MPRAPSERNQLSGIKSSIDVSASMAQARTAHCNVFSVNTIGYLMGYSTASPQAVDYVDRVVIRRAISAGAHFVELLDDESRHRGWATNISSTKKARELNDDLVAKIHRGEITDTTPGSAPNAALRAIARRERCESPEMIVVRF